jgi:hypothetical protein
MDEHTWTYGAHVTVRVVEKGGSECAFRTLWNSLFFKAVGNVSFSSSSCSGKLKNTEMNVFTILQGLCYPLQM